MSSPKCGTDACVECGAIVYTCEYPDQLAEGDIACVLTDPKPHMRGCELNSGGWVCSEACWESACERQEVKDGSIVDDFGMVLGVMNQHNLKVVWRRVPERRSGKAARRLLLVCTDPDDADTIVNFLESEFELDGKIWEGPS